jgi:quinol---cytochrome-c reductase cytochrome c subunit
MDGHGSMPPRRRLAAAGAVVTAALIGFSAAGQRPAPARPLGQAATPAAAGPLATALPTPIGSPAHLYLRDCAWCHGSQGEGTIYGPSLAGVGAASADFMLRTGRMPIPEIQAQPQRAPSTYSREEIDELIRSVEAFGPGPEIPAVDPSAGDLAIGAGLYEDDCAACHGSTAAGGALTSGLLAPDLGSSTAVEIAEAMRIGGAGVRSGNMPVFGPDTIDRHELDSIARYVLYLRDPEDRGGYGLGHLGPIPEGFVAWMVGLLAIVLVVRWIGERT